MALQVRWSFMLALVLAFVAILVTFLLLEGGWLAIAGPRLYKPAIGELLSKKLRPVPAAVFYLLYVVAMVWLNVLPNASHSWSMATVDGAVLGLAAYGTYDLTFASTMKMWSTTVTIADMAWGALATALASTAGVLVLQNFKG